MRQFGRQYRLLIGNDVESIEITSLRVNFEISKTISSEPNPATVQVYNLNESHRNAITSKLYNHLSLAVGYGDGLRVIYTGDIIGSAIDRSGLDLITSMECGDGFDDYVGARVNTTIRAGATDAEILGEAAKVMQKSGTGVISLPKDRSLPRGKVMTGNAREVLTKIAKNNDADWSIQDGNLIMLPKDRVLAEGEGFLLSQETGMINSPEKTDDGLKVTCLLNPSLRIGGLVRVQSIIKNYNGDYKITEITHSGDFLENNWHTTVMCVGGQFKKI